MANTFLQLPQMDISPVEVQLAGPVSIDKIRVWDGADILSINADGSINTRQALTNDLQFSEISNLASSENYTVVLTKVATGGTVIYSYEAAGDTIAEFIVKLNGAVIDHKWSNATNYSVYGQLGPTLSSSDTVEILVRHNRPTLGAFSAKLFFGK